MIKKIFSLGLMFILATTAWADHDKVSTTQTTVWEFSGQTKDATVESTTNNNGLYIMAKASSSMKYSQVKRSGTFSDGSSWTTTTNNTNGMALYLACNSNLTPTTSYFSDLSATGTNRTFRSVAFETAIAGKIYAAVYVGNATSGSVNLYKVASEEALVASINVEDKDATYKTATLEYEATESGIFVLGSKDANTTLCYMKFVPEAVSAPTISNNDGSITITSGTSNLTGDGNVTIKTYYTTDGTDPTASSTEYTGTFNVTTSCTVKAISINTVTGTTSEITSEVVTITPTPPSGDAVSVFLTAGQSNTAGRCMNENLPDYIKTLGTSNNGAYQYCNWSYTNGSTRKSESEGVFRKFWPEMESSSNSGRFAYDAIVYYWIEQALQKDFYVVKHAMGGTSIDPTCTSSNDYHWSADATWLAEHASCNTEGGTSMLKAFCDNIGKSLDALSTDGKAYDIKAMIWHQGESDRSGTGPDGYHDNLKAVVKYVRDYLVTKTGDSKYATLDFICGTVPTNSKQYNKKVYDALFTLASEDSHFHVIETSPGTFIGDDLHFDTNCAERLGIGMYNKMVDLGLVSGTKQTVPEVIYPEGQPITLNFQQWAIDNIGTDKSVQKALTLSAESTKALDGTTNIYKAIGCEAEGDFSEFAETFALSANEVKMRGNVGLQLNSNKVITFSIPNLNPGDGVTVTFGAGSSGVTTLATLSENIFVSDDATQTVLAAGTALTSKTVTYVVKNGTQIDLTFGSTGGHYINSIVITPDAVEILPTKPTVTLKTDGDEEKVYTATFLEGETLHYTSPDATEEQTVTFSTENNGSVDITVTKAGDLVCWTTRGTSTTESTKNTTTVTFSSGDEPTTAITIHTIGDSTMSSYDQSIPAQAGMDGWGDYLIDCMKTEWVTVNNWADRGETAKSYYNGIWNKTSSDRPEFLTPIAEKVNAGDYVIIQFGHNDSKAYDTATYEEWLGTLVDAVKAKGATPIMAGSICRARFDSNGKITRLGRIDTGEENGVGEDDHTYDYPYHAKAVATAKGIEFIDVTSGVKDMFETYGEAKTKALFPSGEKTHTNKLGAQLIAKVAAKLLLNTAIANYVDQETLALPDVDDIDVVIDDFGSEATVTRKTIWTFNDVEAGTAISDGNNEIVNRNGLYVRGRADARAINAAASTLTSVTFSDNTAQTVNVVAQTAGANTATESTIGQNTAGRAAANGLAPMFALNIATPGTFYAIMAPTKKATDRNINLFFSGKLVDSKVINDVYDATTDHLCELKYHAESTGVIYIAAGIASNLYAAMFVPDMEAGTEEDWNYQMVKTREDGYWTYCNRMSENQKVPEGLTAYAVSSINADGKAVLTDIGSIITPGMGVIVKGESNTEYPMVSTTEAATYTGENLLVGNATLQYLPATTGDKTNFYFEDATTGFVKATGGETIHEKQAYLSVTSTAKTIPFVTEQPSYAFSATVATEGTGSVTYKVEDSEENSTATTFTQGTRVVLTATPANGYLFDSWKVNNVVDTEHTINTLTVTINAETNVIATFKPEESVNVTTAWTFDDLSTGTIYNSVSGFNKAYLRGATAPNRTFTVTALEAAQMQTFADGTEIEVNKYIASNAAASGAGSLTGVSTAASTDKDTDSKLLGAGMFAVNTTVPGTLYAKVSSVTANKKIRIYFADGTEIKNQTWTPADTEITEISYTSTAEKGGTFFVGGVEAAYNIYAVRFVPTSEAVKYTLTLTQPEAGGTIAATVNGEAVDGSMEVLPGAEVTLTATPSSGYQMGNWKDSEGAAIGDIPQSISTTVTMPAKALTVTAAFAAQPTSVPSITTETVWTFDGLTAGQKLAGAGTYEYNGLYIGGHSDTNFATVSAGNSTTTTNISDDVTNYIALAGGYNSDIAASETANTYKRDAISFHAGVPGTVSVYMSGTYAEGRTFNIWNGGTKYTTDMPNDNSALLVTQEIGTAGAVFIATSAGSNKIYAIKFEPALPQPTVAWKENTTDSKAVYTITSPDDNNIKYQLGDADAVDAGAKTTDVEVSEKTTLKAWTYNHARESAKVEVTLLATPIIEVNGIYDFKGMTQDSDYMPITLESEAAATIGETTVYAPDVMTAQTFNGKYAFSSDYNNWRLRKNYGIMVEKNKEGYMAILGLKQGLIVKIDMSGAESVTNMTTTVISDEAISNGTEYTVAADGDLLLKIGSTTATNYIQKVSIVTPAEKSEAAVYDFLNVVEHGEEIAFATDGLTVYNKEYNATDGWVTKKRTDFYAATTFDSKVSVRNGASGLTYDTSKKTVRLTKPLAIHNLAVDDEIVIIYTGDGTLRSAGADEGDVFTINGETATPGMEIPSGATIKVTKQKNENNYVVVTPAGPTSGKVYISAIYVNKEVEQDEETATIFYVSPDGNDENKGIQKSAPFKTLKKAQERAKSGNTIYILPGTYKVSNAEYMDKTDNTWNIVYQLDKDDIQYIGEMDTNGQRPVFDFSSVTSEDNKRITGFHVAAKNLVIKNIETIGINVATESGTQSENFRLNGATDCQLVNIAAHDGQGIGFYIHRKSAGNIIKNCDAYENYDKTNNDGGNNDGFGCHVSEGCEGNQFVGCRAWYNADDGFDLKSCFSKVVIEDCIAYKNGYATVDGTLTKLADGNGFKAGGFGKNAITLPEGGAPVHEVNNCIAADNKANAFYSNHHLGGLQFSGNRAYRHSKDYYMINRDIASINSTIANATDPEMNVAGYGHILLNNLSYNSTTSIDGIDVEKCTVTGNSFKYNNGEWTNDSYTESDFVSLDLSLLTKARKSDGSLADDVFNFMLLKDAGETPATPSWTESAKEMGKVTYTIQYPADAELHYILPGTSEEKTITTGTEIGDGQKECKIEVTESGDLKLFTQKNGKASAVVTVSVTMIVLSKPTISTTYKENEDSYTYTITYQEGATLYYTLPGSEEQSKAGGESIDVNVTKIGDLTAYATYGELTSETASQRVYAPTPAIVNDNTYDFALVKESMLKDYTLGTHGYGDAITIGSVAMKKPDAVVAKTLDRFAFTSEYTENETTKDGKAWILLSAGRLRGKSSAHDKSFAILNLKKGNFLTLTYSGAEVKYAGGSATLAEGTDVLTSGTGYEILADGNLLLTVPANTEKHCDITVIRIATTETVSAPTLEERKEGGEVVPNKVTIRLGTSSFGKTVTAYYTIDGSTPTTSSTAVTKNGAITVDESCTIKAYCVSETGVASGITEYKVTLPAASASASKVYDFLNVVQHGDEIAFASDGLTVYNKEFDATDGWVTKQRKDFNAATTFDSKVSVRSGASGLTYDTTNKTIRLTKAMAIHNLGVGDEIVIIYTGDGTLRSAGADEGDGFTINGKTATAGMEIPSGATIKVTNTKYINNYVVVTPAGPTSGKVYISAIYVNHAAPNIANTPKCELTSVDLNKMTSTYRITFDEGATLYYVLESDGTTVTGSNTGSYDLVISEGDKLKAWEVNGTLTSDVLEATVYAPTPAPSTTGSFDFTEASEDLPADIEVTLNPALSVNVGGETLYKPAPLTAATFGDKFAFTETGSNNKIRIRTNHQLVFAKGTNMSMGLLNLKKGDVISFDYTGTIDFADPSQVSVETSAIAARATTRAVSSDLESGTAYIVQTDGDILLKLTLTEASVSISKMYIAAAPTTSAAKAIDFASAAEEYEDLDIGSSTSVWFNGKTSAQTFKKLANTSNELPIDGKISSESGSGEITIDGIKASNRHIAIHNLAVGDEILVRFYGGALTYDGNETRGDRVSVNGKVLAAQDTLKTGDVLVINKVDYLNNYVVLKLDSKCCISGIFINREEIEKVWAPTIVENGKNTVLITAGRSSMENETTTYYTTDGTTPSDLNGIGGPYPEYDVELLDGQLVEVKAISYSSTGLSSKVTTLVMFADSRTEIIGVPVEDDNTSTIYDLWGRRVDTPRPGQIYIINGKKVLYKRK